MHLLPRNSGIGSQVCASLEVAVFVDEVVEKYFKFCSPLCFGQEGYVSLNGLLCMIANLGDDSGTR